MLLGWQDRLAAATLTASAEASTLPVSNVVAPTLDLVWRLPASSGYIDFDLGSSLSFKVIALVGTTLTSAATLRVRASDTDFTTGDLLDTGVLSSLVDNDYRSIFKEFASVVTARYGRIDIVDSSLSEIDIGVAFLTPVSEPANNQRYGWEILPFDRGRRTEVVNGQVVTGGGPRGRGLTFDLDLTEAEAYTIPVALDRAAGQTGLVLAMADQDGSYVSQTSVIGFIQRATGARNYTTGRWRKRFTIREQPRLNND